MKDGLQKSGDFLDTISKQEARVVVRHGGSTDPFNLLDCHGFNKTISAPGSGINK